MQPENVILAASTGMDALMQFCAQLQPLPTLLRYYDEFDDSTRSISSPAEAQLFELYVYGRITKIDFKRRREHGAQIFKHVFAMMLEKNLSPASIASSFAGMHEVTDDDLEMLLRTGPLEIGLLWSSWRAREWQRNTYSLAKHVLYLLCIYRWNGWSNEYISFLKTTLPLPATDKYSSVRSGDSFLSADEEALIVRHLDGIATGIQSAASLPYSSVADAGMLICAYQFAMRPVQIAMLDSKHVRIWHDGTDADLTVHLTFHMAKQRGKKTRISLTRRVKREWACIFVYLHTSLKSFEGPGDRKFFQAQCAQEVGRRIATLVYTLIGTKDLGNATDLRHTAAQRLVDAGASHEELAEFLGHSHTVTGLVYFATSASHAERVNRALGASDIYRQVAKISHDRFISPSELAALKEDQQIAAVPHGMPIAGIGGCRSGQPACPYNPITSCYGCRKFMPTTDLKLHGQVLSDMREVVLFFERSSRADVKSPAYMQLQRTISEIQTVIGELEGEGK
ncbi:site-specific integrase [Herbaspirillum sp. WGmk3]|uniref:site-specific integrase n=1 Tax=Herbaspirillum sp. WGmk3 TaxID=2919925 RepID=UPI002091CEED|nr:site-specific integrase [Herbaspirillum sp. WGmk3]MCO4856472.1 site-specific integrase [Herbaspirillum sp. WGmk3]